MDSIINLYCSQRIEQILKSSQAASIGATSAKNIESVNVSKEFLEVLNISFELQTQDATELLEKKDLISITESKIEILFQNIITLEAQEKDVKLDDIIALAITYYNMGLIYLDTKLHLVMSETHFIKCTKLLKEKELEHKAIVIIISVLIKLYAISYERGQSEESYSFLDTAMELYLKYTKDEIEYPNPINLMVILGIDNENETNSKIILENLHLAVLLNMSTSYKENVRDKHKFIIHIHSILNKLIETVSRMLSTYQVDWAITSGYLSHYFAQYYRFTEARNHIIAAEYMMKMYDEKVVKIPINSRKKASFLKCKKHGNNNVIKFWGLYGAELLAASTDGLLLREKANKSFETDNSKSESVVNSKEYFTKLLIFTHIGKDFENFASRFSEKCASNLNDAKMIFDDVLKCFDTINEYFKIGKYMRDFLDIRIATSKIYKCLATFEQEKDKQILLHKQQIQILQNVFELTEPNMYNMKVTCPSIFYQIIPKIVNELIGSHITILDIETDHLLLNIGQLNRTFTDEIDKSFKKSLTDIIKIHKYATETFDVFKD